MHFACATPKMLIRFSVPLSLIRQTLNFWAVTTPILTRTWWHPVLSQQNCQNVLCSCFCVLFHESWARFLWSVHFARLFSLFDPSLALSMICNIQQFTHLLALLSWWSASWTSGRMVFVLASCVTWMQVEENPDSEFVPNIMPHPPS